MKGRPPLQKGPNGRSLSFSEAPDLTQGKGCPRGKSATSGTKPPQDEGDPQTLSGLAMPSPALKTSAVFNILKQDGRTQGFMEPGERVTQALSFFR